MTKSEELAGIRKDITATKQTIEQLKKELSEERELFTVLQQGTEYPPEREKHPFKYERQCYIKYLEAQILTNEYNLQKLKEAFTIILKE